MGVSRDMTFRRFGRSRHLRIETADDLACALDLDEARWVAIGAPIDTLSCDATFLSLVDTDHNGRIMCFEIRQAIQWLLQSLRDTSGVSQGSRSLRLDAISTEQGEGRRIHNSASKMLARAGRGDSPQITLEQVRRIKAGVAAAPVSEGGIVLPQAAQDDRIGRFITDVIATVGGADHPGGSKGVDKAHLDEFLTGAKAYLDWRAQGLIGDGREKTEIMPLGTKTSEAFRLYTALAAKIDQYFAQCEAVAFDGRTAERAAANEAQLQALDFADPQAIDRFIRQSPLAKPRPDMLLEFDGDINPRYAGRLRRLQAEVIEPALGVATATISREQWRQVKRFLAAHEAWAAAKAGAAVEAIGPEMLSEYLDERYRGAIEALIARSAAAAIELDDIRLTEKLILYQAHLLSLANNFISFPHLYDRTRRAMFEMGTLVMDGRRFNFAIKVADRARHSRMAKTGSMYVLYVEVLDTEGKPRCEIALPVTSGGEQNLCVGKRGVFQDISGGESDARVVEIIENPISLAEALVSPFQRLARALGGKIEALTTSTEKKLDAAVSGAVQQAQAPAPVAAAGQPNRGLMAGGLLMGASVALAALGSAFAYVSKTLSGVAWYKIVIGIAVAILAVMLPAAIVGIMKLRRRDLSAILEGSGWAINARMRLTMKQGRFFTHSPALPKGRPMVRGWVLWLLLVGALAAANVAAVWYVMRDTR